MDIKVLGTGCKKCQATKAAIKEVLAERDDQSQIEEVGEMSEILKYNVMATPGVVIDGKVVSWGKVPKKKEIEGWLLREK
jgi:small redox-active disulfide protein 2